MSTWMRVLVAAVTLTLSAGCVGDSEGAPPTQTTPTSTSTNTESGTPGAAVDTDPYDTVRHVYRGVAANLPDEVCARFTTEAARQFAGQWQAESCTTVVTLLHHGRVGDPEAYANTNFGYFTAGDGDTHAEIDSCEFEVLGGPQLGVFVLDRNASDTWLITAHRMDECDR
ncbi:hypothetical protein [Actinophytocola algeriensis]|uniref:Lipoprotein n=1 Tax=Actinophytocola algeriensis TaxID=1768010 RepID=A0A7W7Q2Q6_9PSEU|nr:hypothetical protein [Actinophytocola algeriensis]MBB4905871.1 hypothetical protein [Actinophytocola algeriensis]MBE1472444.1 hypothetical protein [Actinophytocola algeriensis]